MDTLDTVTTEPISDELVTNINPDGTIPVEQGETIEEKLLVTLPDKYNIAELETLYHTLSDKVSIRGVQTFRQRISKYLYHFGLCDGFYDSMITSVAYLAGERRPVAKKNSKVKSLHNTVEQFYNTLTTPMLRSQCELFNLDFNSYEDIDNVVAALVDVNVTLMKGNHKNNGETV
jgi:hypothetical protein